MTDPQELNSRARRAFLWLSSTTAIWQGCSWVLTVITARILVPSDYGMLALFEAAFPYLLMASTLRLDAWMMSGEIDERTEEEVFSLALLCGVGSSALALIAAPYIAEFYREPRVVLPFQCSAVIFFFRSLQLFPETRLRKQLNLKPVGLCNLAVGVSRGILQLVLALMGFSFWSLVVGGLYREIFTTAWLWRAAGGPKRLRFSFVTWRAALSFGVTATSSSLLWVLFSTADNIAIGRLFGTEALGYYSMAFFLSELPLSKLNSVITPLLQPYLAGMRHNLAELRGAFLRVSQGILSLVAPCLVGLSAVASSLVPVLFGEHWMPMGVILQAMAFVGLLRAVAANGSIVFLVLNKPRTLFRWTFVVTIFLVPSFFILGRFFGMPGVFLGWLVVYPIVGVLGLFRLLEREVGFTAQSVYRAFSAPILSSLIMGGAVILAGSFVPEASPSKLVGLIFVGMFSYLFSYRQLFRREFEGSVVSLRNLMRR